MNKTFPMLSSRYSQDLVEQAFDKDPDEITSLISTAHSKSTLSPSSGQVATEVELHQLRKNFVELATQFGFPHRKGADFVGFDQALTLCILDLVDAPAADARSAEMWNFLTCVLLLDVAAWRYENTAKNPLFNRYLGGGPKHVFAKIWFRAWSVGKMGAQLGEDQAVQIMERTGMSGNRQIARSMVAQFFASLEEIKDTGGSPTEGEMMAFRRYVLELSIFSTTRCFAALGEKELRSMMRDVAYRTIDLKFNSNLN